MEGYPIKLVIPSEGAGFETEVNALMKTAKNKEDAKQFLDWLLTLEAAKLYGERSEMSSVPGAKAPDAVLKAGLPPDVSVVLYKMDFAGVGEEQGPHHRRVEAEDRTLAAAFTGSGAGVPVRRIPHSAALRGMRGRRRAAG